MPSNESLDDWLAMPPDDTHYDDFIDQEQIGRLDKVRNVLSDSYYSAVDRFRDMKKGARAAVAGALVVGVLVGGGLATESVIEHFEDKTALLAESPKDIKDYVTYFDQKSHDKNKDPSFRATSVSVMQDGTLLGSGSLIKQDGHYMFATVEHVARPMFGLPDIAHSAQDGITIGGGESNPEDHGQNAMLVPGVGIIKLPSNKSALQILGKEASEDSQDDTDRFSLVELPGSVQRILDGAEDFGKIKVPEVGKFKAEVGDQFWMPLADTGEKVPFIYAGSNRENGDPLFVPLVILSEQLDYQAARDTLLTGIDRGYQESLADAESVGAELGTDKDDFVYPWSVIRDAGVAFEERHEQDDFEDDNGVTNWLACMGDSGSPLLDNEGKVVGMLSSGSPFSNGKNEVHLPRYNLLNFDCLADATFSLPHK